MQPGPENPTPLERLRAADQRLKNALSEYEGVVQTAEQTTDTPPQKPAAPQPDPWPVIASEAYNGIAGEIVKAIDPHTEADPVALLVSVLAEFGIMIGRGPHLILDGAYHPLLIFPVLVGKTSKGRKGSADKRIRGIYQAVDSSWTRGRYKGTLSSGEGLVWAVCDPDFTEKNEKPVCIEPGVTDKRLHLIQPEFGSVLRVMSRDGNSLSGTIRDAWDGEDLAPMTKGSRIRATAPHIGILGHVTQDELLRHLTDTEASNGFGNRFMWLAVRRSKELPFPTVPVASVLNPLIVRMRNALDAASQVQELSLTEDAKEVWQSVYHELSADRPGLAGALLNRSEAYAMRLAALYALLDSQKTIDAVHLQAALALWDYSERSVYLIFGDKTGDPVADTILRAVKRSGGMADTEIYNIFSRNVSSARLSQAKAILKAAGLIKDEIRETGGRKETVWRTTH